MDKELIIGRKYLDRNGRVWEVIGLSNDVFRPYAVQLCTGDDAKYATVHNVTRYGSVISDIVHCVADLVKEFFEEKVEENTCIQSVDWYRQEFIDNAAIKIMGVLEYNDNTIAAKQAYCLAEELWEERKRRLENG